VTPLSVTIALFASGLGFTALFGWLGARPPRDFTRPRMVPWRLLMLLGAALTALTATHLISLLKPA
jgi:hypothetical protein